MDIKQLDHEYVDPNYDMGTSTRQIITSNPWEDLAIALEDQLTFYKLNKRENVRIIDHIRHIREAVGQWEDLREENDTMVDVQNHCLELTQEVEAYEAGNKELISDLDDLMESLRDRTITKRSEIMDELKSIRRKFGPPTIKEAPEVEPVEVNGREREV